MVLLKVFNAEHSPDVLRALVILRADVRLVQLAVERFYWREACLRESFSSNHVLVGVAALSSDTPKLLIIGKVSAGVNKSMSTVLHEVVDQSIERCVQKLQAVQKPYSSNLKCEKFLFIIRNYADFFRSEIFLHIFDNQ